jgi:catechol 2,3-dioxygenase
MQQLPRGTRLGPVHLGVTDELRAVDFWTRILGLSVVDRSTGGVAVGAGGRGLVVLHPGAASKVARGHTGLYHVALHFTERREFARALARLFAHRYPHSPTDHLVTETTYVWDPDGNGVEFTFETPERGALVIVNGQYAGRTPDGRVTSGRDPLDLDSVFSELTSQDDPDAPIPGGLRVGHVHLHVPHLADALRFYTDVIGFKPLLHMPAIGMADANVDDGVPHTIALNTWAGVGAPPPPADAAGLRHFTLELPDKAGVSALAARLQQAKWPVEATDDGLHVRDPGTNLLHVR